MHSPFTQAPGCRQVRAEPWLVLAFLYDNQAGLPVVLGYRKQDGVGAHVDRGQALGRGTHFPV
jgi:hypothetical protein